MGQAFARRRRFIGRVMTSLTAGALSISILMIVGLFFLVAGRGLAHFWPSEVWAFTLDDGTRLLGEIHEREINTQTGIPGIRIKTGNRDVTELDFRWVPEDQIVETSQPEDAVLLERREWGNFYGSLVEVRRSGEVLARGEDAWPVFLDVLAEKRAAHAALEEFERFDIGDLNYVIEDLRLERRRLEMSDRPESRKAERLAEIDRREREQEDRYEELARELQQRRDELDEGRLLLETAGGRQIELPVSEVVRAVRPNRLGTAGKTGVFFSRVWEFLSADPREANTEGGVFPAIFGTVMMVFLMSFAVVPFGVTAAVYLREYAKDGPLVRLIRVAVNNLAGVPSIVFGVFGLGFFVYFVGGSIDALFYPERLPSPTYGTGGILWASLTLALLTLPVVIVATEEGLAAVPRNLREGSRALGGTRFETLFRVTLPAALPGVLTGVILAMARAAGEVAPLMIVGMVKLAPSLPVDHHFPFIHPERKFMHLGFHIFDVGFQSPNVEAAKPLAYATTLLILLLVFAMTLTAVIVRERLRSRYRGRGV